jgi:hypothetical protein
MSRAIANCTIKNIKSVQDAALMYYDHCVETQDVPKELAEYDSDEFVETVKLYLSVGITGGVPTLLIEYDTEDVNGSAGIFEVLAAYFRTVQSSLYMRVKWVGDDTATDFGVDYYDRQHNKVNVDDAVFQFLKANSLYGE